MIYADNSASSFYKPPCVINAVVNSLRHFPANSGRSGHSEALKGARLVQNARMRIASFCSLGEGTTIFTDNCTGALNLAILGGIGRGHIVTSVFEHNAVLRPIYELVKRGKNTVSFARPRQGLTLRTEDIVNQLKPDTVAVVLTHISNVTGAISPLEFIGRECKKRGILFIVDAAQSAGHYEIDMDRCNIDMLALAPHKGLHAIQGLGVLLVREGVRLKPVKWGGTGSESFMKNQPDFLPDGVEAGTLPLPAICALSAALGWCEKSFYQNKLKLRALSALLAEQSADIPSLRVYSDLGSSGGIFTFNIGDIPSTTVADILSNEYGICVRGGVHCAPLTHLYLNTEKQGAVRISLGCDNTERDIELIVSALKEIAH